LATVLSAMRLFNVPCWSTLGAARLDKIAIPDRVGRLVIFADADQPGQDAARRAAVRYRKPGREVLVETPPAGDWNDALAAKAGLR
jgi:DNA primase